MSEDDMLKCLIAFVLGFLVAHMIRGNGLMVGCPLTHNIVGRRGMYRQWVSGR
jgi:hypothetical protein